MWILLYFLVVNMEIQIHVINTYDSLIECEKSLAYVDKGMRQAYPDDVFELKCQKVETKRVQA